MSNPGVVDVLDEQHRHIADLFEQVGSPDADRPAVLSRLLKDLAAHIAVERAIVEPVVKHQVDDERSDAEDGPGLAEHLMSDYDRMERLMVLIERRKSNSPDVPDLVTELMDITAEHHRRADDQLIPALQEALTPEEQQDLGNEMGEARAMTTSHPHPHLLTLGKISDKLVAVLSRWDRMRDRTVSNLPPTGEAGRKHAETVRSETEAWREQEQSHERERGKGL